MSLIAHYPFADVEYALAPGENRARHKSSLEAYGMDRVTYNELLKGAQIPGNLLP